MGSIRSRRQQFAVLPLRSGCSIPLEVLLITSRETKRWVIPKGWPMAGLSNPEAAMIEAFEEAGVRGRIIGHGQAGTYSYLKEQPAGLPIKLRVGVFLMAVEKVFDYWPEQPERERRWFNPAEAAGLVAEPKLAQLIEQLPQTVSLPRTKDDASAVVSPLLREPHATASRRL